MTQNYISANGLVVQDLNSIVQEIQTNMNNIYGSNINVEQNSPDGQFINISAQEKKDVLDLVTQFYNNLDVDRVIGIPQQILYKLNGLTIKAYTYSYCYVNVTTTQALTLQGLDENIDNANATGYTVMDTNGNRWILAETTVFDQAETKLLNFRAAELGQVTSLPNMITVMETIVAGVSGVNNPAPNYITGEKGESSSEFRLRRNRMLEKPSQSYEESLQGQLLDLDNVTQAKVYSNRTSSTVNDIPAHTVWVIVQGGDSDNIGRLIYNNVPPGIPMKGTQEVEITKLNGDIETVYYDLPTSINLYIQANIKQLTTTAIDDDFVKEQLAQTTYEIGESAESANLTTALKDILGGLGSPYDVEVSTDGTNFSEYVTPTALDEYFVISTDNITLTVVV